MVHSSETWIHRPIRNEVNIGYLVNKVPTRTSGINKLVFQSNKASQIHYNSSNQDKKNILKSPYLPFTMKLSIAAVTSFIAASVAASLPEAFTLVADGGKTVLTDGCK